MDPESASRVRIDPDVHPAMAGAVAAVPEEELARAGLYRLLALLLGEAPDRRRLDVAAALKAGKSTFGRTVSALAQAAREADPAVVEREFHALFIGLGEGELVPYGSSYLSGFLHERPLARLREDLRALGVARAEESKEPEDGIASLCEIMAGLIIGAFGQPCDLAKQREFFDRHIGSWAPRFFADLEAAEAAKFYRLVGAFGRQFMALETQAFAIPAGDSG